MAVGSTHHLALLGAARVTVDGDVVPLRPKVLALLAHLALESHQRHARRSLGELLWPELPSPSARNNLRLALFKLRKALGHDDLSWLVTDRDHVMAAVDGPGPHRLTVDVLQLVAGRLPLAGHRPLADVVPDGCDGYDDWWGAWRERVRLASVAQLEVAARSALADGRSALAEEHARQLLAIDPLVEAGHEIIIRALLSQQRPTEARRQVRACRSVLADELGIPPSPVIDRLTDAIEGPPSSIEQRSPPPPDSDLPLDTKPLPSSLTSFYGRQAEIQALSDAIRRRSARLLSVVGPGGIGKTRLCLEVARGNERYFDEGAVFVSLEAVRHADQIPSAIATALGLTGVAAEPDPLAALIDRLADREVLIIADNAEHLIDEGVARLLVDLVAACPDVMCLVSSRMELLVSAEDVLHLGGLTFPEDAEAAPERFDAVRLLVDRIRRNDKAFRLSADTADAVVAICRQVEGMPLGLELAASASRTQPLAQVVRMLVDAPDAVITDLRDAAPRHTHLAAVYQHSVELLHADDRRVLEQLSVFRGGLTAEAAATVADADGVVLARLCRASMLDRRPSGRYRMHELIRQLAESALDAEPQAARVRGRHAAHYLALLDAAAPALNRAGAATLVRGLGEEWGNLRAAWAHSTAIGEVDRLVASSAGLVAVALTSGFLAEAAAMLSDAVTVATSPRYRATLLLRHATLVVADLETLDPLTPLMAEAMALASDLDDGAVLLAKLQLLWAVALNEIGGDAPAARIALAEADRLAADAGDAILYAFVTLRRGYEALDICDFSAAAELMGDAFTAFDRLGHERGAAIALQGLSCTHDEHHELGPALAAAEAASRRFRAMGSSTRALMAEEMRGQRLVRLGAFEEAAAVLTDVIDGYRRRGILSLVHETRVSLGSALAGAGRIEEAEDAYATGIRELTAAGQPNMLRFLLFPWARFLLEQGRTVEAELAAADLVRLNRAAGAEPLVGASEALLGHAVLQAGNPADALTHVDAAWRAVGGERMAEGLIDPILTMLDCRAVFSATGQPDRAAEALAVAGVHVRRAAAAITDPMLRGGYLSRVAACRAVAAAERAGSAV